MRNNIALISTVSISQWSGRIYSGKAAAAVKKHFNAKKTPGNFVKKLIDGDHIMDIRRKATEIRKFHEENTLPWGDNGDRIVPLGKDGIHITKYMREIKALADEFDTLVEDFLGVYEDLQGEAAMYLGDLFNPGDYPSEASLRDKFAVRISYTGLPADTEDFRLDITNEKTLDALREEIGISMTSRHDKAVESMFEKVREVITRIKHAGGRKEGQRRKFFKNSVFEAIETMVNTFPALNYTKNAKIAKMTNDLKSLLIDPAQLRGNDEATQAYVNRAKELEEKYFSI